MFDQHGQESSIENPGKFGTNIALTFCDQIYLCAAKDPLP